MTSSELTASISERPANPAAWLTTGRFAMFLAALIFVAYPQVVLGFHSFVWRDYGLFGYPLAHYHKECFWRGEIPLWNPYNNFGIPYLAQWGTMVLYPGSLIYLLLPLPWSLGLFTLSHQLLGGVGMFVLARRWTGNPVAAGVAGVAFAFNGFMLNCLMWPNYTASLGWMPWVFLMVVRGAREGGRWIFLAALVGGMQMLSGTPEVILLTWLLLAGVWLVEEYESLRQRLVSGLRFCAIVGFIAALAAAQLLPFLELLQQSDRSSGFDTGRWPLPASAWANLFVPVYRMHQTGAGVYFHADQNLTSSYYVGVAVLVAALLAPGWAGHRRVWWLFGVTSLGFVYAMGTNTPLYDWLRTGFPALGFMRYPSKMVILVAFALPLLAAYSIAAYMTAHSAAPPKPRSYVGVAVVGLAVLVITGIVAHAYWVPDKRLPTTPVFINGALRIVFLLATVGACWGLTRALAAKRRMLMQASLLMLVAFDLLTHAPQQNPTVDREALTVVIPWLKHMRPRPQLGESRVALSLTARNQYLRAGTSNLTETYIAQRNGLYCNLNLLEGMPKADGFYPLYLGHERAIHFELYQATNEVRTALGRFLGFSQVTSPTNIVVWHARTNYLPLVTAGQLPIFTNKEGTFAGLIATNFMPELSVYLPPEATNDVSVTALGAAKITSRKVTAHKVSVDVSASAPSLVVIAQMRYPRWKSFVNGKPVRLLEANHAFQAVEVPAGDHHVDVIYQDKPFQIGAAVSLLALGGIGLGWALSSRKPAVIVLDQDITEAARGEPESVVPPAAA